MNSDSPFCLVRMVFHDFNFLYLDFFKKKLIISDGKILKKKVRYWKLFNFQPKKTKKTKATYYL